jgi:Cu/Ag efflux protein CusF
VPRTPPWVVPALFVILLTAFAAGIWSTYRADFPGKGLYRATGIYEGRWGETMILVRHDAVSGLMEQMNAMAFPVESSALLDRAALRPGDRIRFTIRQLPDTLLVVDIQKMP